MKFVLDPLSVSGVSLQKSETNVFTGNTSVNSANVSSAGAVMNTDTTTSPMQFVIDEDDMASDSDTKVPTQQSVKAYVDNSIDTAVPHVDGISSPLFLSPPRETGTMITSWQSGHGWTVTGTGATSNLNDTSDFILGSQSAYGVSNGAGAATNMRKTGLTNIDMTSKSLRLLMKVDGLSRLNSLSIYLGNAGFANYYLTAIYNPGESKTIIDGEWAWLEFNFNGASAPTTSGSPSKATITDIQIRWTDDSTGAVTIHFNGLVTIDDPAPFPNGVVSIQFDDTYISQYTTAAPILDKYGFPASAMTIVDQVGADANHMSLDQLHELHDKHGWEVAAHANTAANHNLTYTGMTTSDVDSDMRAMKQWLVSNGFGDGDYLAYPLGAYDSSVEEVAAKYYSAARTVIPSPANVIPAYNQFRLRSKSVSNTTTTGQIQTLIDNAYSNKNWLILTFHHIVTTPSLSTEFSTANFTTVVNYLASKGIPVRTTGEVMKAATSRYTPNTVTTTATQTMTNKTLTSPVLNTGVSGTAILDEDNMASNSATQLATQQSIKAYVDSYRNQSLMADTGSGTISNTTTETSLQSGVITITAGTLSVGDSIFLTYGGAQLNNSGANNSTTLRLKLNGSAVFSPAYSQGSNAFDPQYLDKYELIVLSSTSILVTGARYLSTALNTGALNKQVYSGTTTVSNLTSNNLTIDYTFQWGTNSSSSTVTTKSVIARLIKG